MKPTSVPRGSYKTSSRIHIILMTEPVKKAVLIPCFNEELTIGKVIDDFEGAGCHIYVFNNNSTDQTRAIAEEKRLSLSMKNRAKVTSWPLCSGKWRQISIFSLMVMIPIRLNQYMNY